MTQDQNNDSKGAWQTFTEEVEVAGKNLVEEVTKLIAEGNVRRLRVHSKNDDVVLEVPLTAGAALGGVVVLGAPWLAILGTIAGLVAHVRIEVVRDVPKDDDSSDEDETPKDT